MAPKEILMRPGTLAAVVLLLAISLNAQTVVVGSQPILSSTFSNSTAPYTVVDLSHPATAAGALSSASVLWKAGSCTSAFKLKFLRPASTQQLSTYTLVAERGPFNAVLGRNQLQLLPPVDVKAGDLIAVTPLQAEKTCGGPGISFVSGDSIMTLAGDVSGGSLNGSYQRDEAIDVRATDTTEILEGVVPVAGSLAGNFGSFFRTSLQITSPAGGTSTGRIVFHPAGVPASPSDQSLPYTTNSSGLSFTDVVQQMGQSGLGTIDVISNNGFPPLVTARIYNDTPAGTSGFTEDMITPAEALHPYDFVVLLTPADLTKFRVNIGVRTFSKPVTLNVQYGFRTQGNVDFPANTFQQLSLAGFGDTSPVANEQIIISVLSGDVIVYASTPDNQTNDSSVRFARRQ
jgi:hypothetical protein